MNNDNIKDNMSDNAFRELFRESLRQAPPSPWFTKKVLNRLPDKRRRYYAWGENVIYLLAVIVSLLYALGCYNGLLSQSHITVGDVALLMLYVAFLVTALIMFLYPWIQRWAELSVGKNQKM